MSKERVVLGMPFWLLVIDLVQEFKVLESRVLQG